MKESPVGGILAIIPCIVMLCFLSGFGLGFQLSEVVAESRFRYGL